MMMMMMMIMIIMIHLPCLPVPFASYQTFSQRNKPNLLVVDSDSDGCQQVSSLEYNSDHLGSEHPPPYGRRHHRPHTDRQTVQRSL